MSRRRTNHGRQSSASTVNRLIWLGLLALLLAVYLMTKPVAPDSVKGGTHLIDMDRPLDVYGTPGWDYHQSLEYDLDGDGVNETVEIIAAVASDIRPGTYQWDDGQPWQVYIKDGDEITHIYNRYVQLGGLDVFVTFEEPPRIGVVENQGAGHALYIITYQGAGSIKPRN